MNNNPSTTGGRRRKLKQQSAGKPKSKRRSKSIGGGLSAAGRWLNQPLVDWSHSKDHSGRLVGILSRQRSLAPRYVRESWAEMRQVTWPRFGQAMRLTFAVVVFAAFFAVLIANIDQLLTRIFEEVIINESQNIRDFLGNIF